MIFSRVQWVVVTLIGQMDNRDYASIILIGLFSIYLLAKGKLLSVIKSFDAVAKLALNPKILIPALILVSYSSLLIYGAFVCGFWNADILLDTILEVVFVGFPSMLVARIEEASVRFPLVWLHLPQAGTKFWISVMNPVACLSITSGFR